MHEQKTEILKTQDLNIYSNIFHADVDAYAVADARGIAIALLHLSECVPKATKVYFWSVFTLLGHFFQVYLTFVFPLFVKYVKLSLDKEMGTNYHRIFVL